MRQMSLLRTFPTACLAVGLLTALPAQAGLFDGDARQQVTDLQKSTSQILIDQNQRIEQLSQDLANLRGQVESLTNTVQDLEKRQKDLYLDLDNRVQALEAAGTNGKGKVGKGGNAAALPITDPAAAATGSKSAPATTTSDDGGAALKAYESALGLFKAGKYKEAATAFDKFGKTYPENEQAPAAQFWLGNSYYALGDCKAVISSQQKLLAKWPKSSRAPDAMANVANCQAELGQKAESQKTLKALVSQYPDSKAAGAAKQQLKK